MIEVQQLTKSFILSKDAIKQLKQDAFDSRQTQKYFNALENVSFSCGKGEVLGLLGPNGAGKTTTLRILASALKPDSGDVTVNGTSLVKFPELAKKSIGFLSNNTGLYQRLTALENITYFAELHGVKASQVKSYGDIVFEALGVNDYLHRRVDTLSTGMKQKVSLARAVIHQPQVLILDEPTTGLDIMATEAILAFISTLKSQGVSVIFSTHHLDEIALLADNIAIINRGKSCFNGSVETLKQSTRCNDLRQAFMKTLQVGFYEGEAEPVDAVTSDINSDIMPLNDEAL